jgi:hypothetical protein
MEKPPASSSFVDSTVQSPKIGGPVIDFGKRTGHCGVYSASQRG